MSHPPQPPPHWTPHPGYYRPAEPGPSVGWAVSLWIVAGLSLVGTLVCGAIAGYGFWISNHMATEGVTTTAVVTEVSPLDDVTLDFTTETGQRVTADVVWWSSDVPAVDDEVAVVYDPDDVTYVLPEGSDEDRIMAIIFSVAAGVGLLVSVGTAIGAILVHRARSRNAETAWPRPH
ncbi:hypothetical protein [Aeromicrobium sp. NPDC092404]|uniref:hypothetical protein n=1 Tax=Aeromicrobium sp. NPDC092404 TaxID=3154976 RepID=UPI003446DEA1